MLIRQHEDMKTCGFKIMMNCGCVDMKTRSTQIEVKFQHPFSTDQVCFRYIVGS